MNQNQPKESRIVIYTLLLFLCGCCVWFFVTIRNISGKIDSMTTQPVHLEKLDVTTRSVDDSAVAESLEIKRTEDITTRIDKVGKNGTIEEVARALAEVDSWIFAPAEENKATAVIDHYLAELGDRILSETAKLDDLALNADTGNTALDLYARGTAIMELFPVPHDLGRQQKLSNSLKRRDQVNRRIGELRHLRYNSWAVGRIESGFIAYHGNLATIHKWDEDDKLVKAASSALSAINPDLLTVTTMEIYLSLVRLTNEAIDEAHQISLAKLLSNPANVRKSLEDF